MDEQYAAHGVTFSYPADWELTEQDRDIEITITVASPHTSFWTLTLFLDRPDPESVVETVLDAFREEYPDLDIYRSKARLCDCKTVSRDIEFFCLELVNSAWVRAFITDSFTALVLYQATDQELEWSRSLLEGMTKSLQCSPTPPGPPL